MSRERFDIVFYAPWAASRVGGRITGVPPGGAETQLVMLAHGMARRGLRTGLIVVASPGELPREWNGIRVLAEPRRRSPGGAAGRGALALSALRSMLRVRTRVLVQRSAGPTTAVAALVARLRGARFVYSSANDVDFEFERVEPRRLNVVLFHWGVRRASSVIVQTARQAQLCRDRFGLEPVVINSVASRAERRTRRPEAFLWVGRLQGWKRPLDYVELARRVPEAHFWMIDVPQPNEPRELRAAVTAAARGLPNFELLEPRPREAIGELLDRTVAVVSTSEYEGVPNVFLEGWARGVPALALSFDPGGLIESRGLGAFAGGDDARFADQARELWLERADQSHLAERCIGYVREEHDPDAVVSRWVDALFGPALR